MLKPLEPLEFKRVLVKVIAVEERRRLLRRRGGLWALHPGSFSAGSRWRLRSNNAIPRRQHYDILPPRH
ncbi:MAG: hypothetical protein GSR85_10640 [Desulfurococcales archaeon]|nr:hypothetical protein [Desulfurococcales archaeon]